MTVLEPAPQTDGKGDERPWRPCVGIMLINAQGLIFTGRRIDTPGDHWQMPQGGIDAGETAREAALRELREETGTDKAAFLCESAHWHRYDLPPPLSRRIWGGRFRGQAQRWFAFRFLGTDDDIDIAAHTPEFSAWAWQDADGLLARIVPFKRSIYRAVMQEFAPWLVPDDQGVGASNPRA